MSHMAKDRSTRWDLARLNSAAAARARLPRCRSRDLKGPLPRSTVRALEIAIRSLPTCGPWPEVDEEGWWRQVLAERRLRRSRAKSLSEKDEDARQRLDHLPVQVADVFLRVVRPARDAESRRANRDVWPRAKRVLNRA